MSNPEKSVLDALKPDMSEPDWSANLEICDILNDGIYNISMFQIIKEKILDSEIEYLVMILLDTIVKNCDNSVVMQIDDEIVTALIEISDKDSSPNSLRAYELLEGWYKAYELRQSDFPSLFAQKKELEHTFFLRFNDNIEPE